jgi:hypothetical protein
MEIINELKSEILRVSECSQWKDDKIKAQSAEIARLKEMKDATKIAFGEIISGSVNHSDFQLSRESLVEIAETALQSLEEKDNGSSR